MDFGKYKVMLVNTDATKDKFKWFSIAKGTDRDMVPMTLDKLKTSILPLKERNKLKKVLSKYAKDGYILKSDVERLYNDMQMILGESTTIKIDGLLGLLG